jgi:hypothetical protein
MLNDMKELFSLLPKLLSEHEENEAVREAVVFACWRKVVGESLRDNTVPFRLYRKQLIVAVADAGWKRHLESMSGQMIFKLNSALRAPEVTFIEFRIDEKTCAEAKKDRKPKVTEEEMWEIALENISPKLRRTANAIKDENLRYQFLLAAGGCLARKKKLQNKD